MNKIILVSLLILAGLVSQSCKAKVEESPRSVVPEFRKDGVLEIHGSDGSLKATFEIEIARKESELMRGLKYRDKMQENQAMLFIFEFLDYHSFWMQDTYLSLDMIFIDHNNQVVHIAKNTTPYSEEQIYPEKPNKYVLEVLAGISDKYQIKETDIVTWKEN
ncbi:MAG: DUF192 domain-containing protein [Candidatus Cloacimonetes bacterium]|nr:DUF192 domain-containing protein [Candidatus Cloacimonadota bacterium]MDD3524105.1 DUF192 domain-containing protein [Candidatus Cloacimonadota bacterium]HQB98588.1 DUF192 domain-containing protein [Candidatus Cloacimonadota bacterium]